MTTAVAHQESFRPDLSAALGRHEPEYLRDLRERARRRFEDLGLPSRRLEEWRFTPLPSVAEVPYRTAAAAPSLSSLDTSGLPGGPRMVFVDGHFVPFLSSIEALPAGVEVRDLQSAAVAWPELLAEHLGRLAGYDDRHFVALNTALLENGAVIRLHPGALLDSPLHLVHLTTAAGGPTVSYPRHLLLAGAGSQAAVVETVIGSEARSLACAVTEVTLEAGAHVELTRVQEEAPAATRIVSTHVRLERDSSFVSRSVSLGGALVRNDLVVEHAGEGSECRLEGLSLTRGEELVDNHLRVIHAVPHCASTQLYKGILDGRSRAVFNGCVVVAEDAQKTDAKQSNRSLLLSDDARVYSNPQLEIFADDVRCTHGSAIGQLDDEAVFYLRSRGIDRAEAANILVRAFAGEVADRVTDPWTRGRLEAAIDERLPVSDSMAGAV